MEKQKLLLDVCCGPCAIAAIEDLKVNNPEFDIMYYVNNSNITFDDEYEKRLEGIRLVLNRYGVTTILRDGHSQEEWLECVKNAEGFETELEGGKRCDLCYRFRLQKTAEHAWRNNIIFFTTTLTAGITKDAEKINAIGKEIGSKYGLIFLEKDFKKNDGTEKSLEICKRLNVYRQNYCGCKFSLNK